ncbi:hypothetical protein PM082_012631 [Marasmius tenuissimus]|nr:hypothetical protein PM082_012631 [Marasmius tenuissimus]
MLNLSFCLYSEKDIQMKQMCASPSLYRSLSDTPGSALSICWQLWSGFALLLQPFSASRTTILHGLHLQKFMEG